MGHVPGALHTVGPFLNEIVWGRHILAVENLGRQNLGPGSVIAGSILLIIIASHGISRFIRGDELMGREVRGVRIDGMSLHIAVLILLTIIIVRHVLGFLGDL